MNVEEELTRLYSSVCLRARARNRHNTLPLPLPLPESVSRDGPAASSPKLNPSRNAAAPEASVLPECEASSEASHDSISSRVSALESLIQVHRRALEVVSITNERYPLTVSYYTSAYLIGLCIYLLNVCMYERMSICGEYVLYVSTNLIACNVIFS